MTIPGKFLSQLYPKEENPWKIILPVSLFIGLFLVVFQPFGLDDLQFPAKRIMLAGYGAVTFLILVFDLVIMPVLWPRFYREENWTVLKELLNYFYLLFTLGVGNLVYSTFIFDIKLTFDSFLVFQTYTLVIGIIPVTAIVLIKQNYLKRKNETSADAINETLAPHTFIDSPGQQVHFRGENQKEELKVNAGEIQFIQSDGNYITIGYLKNNRLTKVLLRNTMKYASDRVAAYPFLYPCHRSWIVNLNRVNRVIGNSQGLRIVIKDFEEEIPVARKNIAEFRDRIATIME
jgi:DNA-binding LytR/AlgR family response regulator